MRHWAAAMLLAGLGTGAAAGGFDLTVLGATGGIEDGNLSAFMIAPTDAPRAITCDAGALVAGIIAAEAKGAFDGIEPEGDWTRVGHVLTGVIKGYMISHPHMDHIAGLIAASPDDSSKPIYALEPVHADIRDTYFNWKAWPNFGTSGVEPHLGKYPATVLVPGKAVPIADTAMTLTAFPLNHDGRPSTAFLVETADAALLCLGDTGPDSVNGGGELGALWRVVAPLAADGRLAGIVIESSYTSDRPDNLLFGHLTPKHVLAELGRLAELAGGPDALAGLTVVVSHVKYSLKTGTPPREQVLVELEAGNDLGVTFVMPEQGAQYRLETP